MKITVLGAGGMIGRGLTNYLREIGHNVNELNKSQFYIESLDSLDTVYNKLSINPEYSDAEWLINCIGIVKQYSYRYSEQHIEYVNGILPQYLSEIANANNKKLLHISTDCVFSGLSGNYDENYQPDATDVYGQSKALSEKISDASLVIRTSTIGVEKGLGHGLLSWYSNQVMPVDAYQNALYSGVSLKELSKSIHHLWITGIDKGLYNISSETISKFDLLNLMYMLGIGPKPLPVKFPILDRSLDDTKYRALTRLKKPNWVEMVHDIKIEIEGTDNDK